MTDFTSSFPYFASTAARALSEHEYAVVAQLLVEQNDDLRAQLNHLVVVGRCGCEACPTIFFQPHKEGDHEYSLVDAFAKDETGGVVGVSLFVKDGLLSQLEVFTADGHDPYFLPRPENFISATNF